MKLIHFLRKSKREKKSLVEIEDVKKTELKKEDKMHQKANFSQEIWDKVEMMLEMERNYYQPNRQKLAERIYRKYNGKNEYNLYKEEIVITERRISEFERECDLNACCQAGCSACCYQLIGINPIEKEILRKAVYKLNVGDRDRIKEKANQIIKKLNEIKFPIEHKTIEKGDFTQEQLILYLNLHLRCPFLNEANKCMIYETRPFACWSYKNYGKREDCHNDIAVHSCAFNDAGLPLLDAFGTINYGKTDLNDFEILPLYLTEIL